MSGYHVRNITKGKLGKPSKIEEEFEEFMDSVEQGNPVMGLMELSDMLGAIELYTTENYNISLQDLLVMTRATERAFKSGTRK